MNILFDYNPFYNSLNNLVSNKNEFIDYTKREPWKNLDETHFHIGFSTIQHNHPKF